MTTNIIDQKQVSELLTMPACIGLMERTLKSLANGRSIQPLRSGMWLPERRGVLGMMPSFLDELGVMGVKVVSVFPANRDTEFDSHQGVVLLYEAAHGQLLAIVDATAITAIRTAAVSAVATDAMANASAGDLALIGSGVQAVTHLDAMLQVRNIRRVRVWSPTAEHRDRYAQRESARHGIAVESVDHARDAVSDADIVCTLTSSRNPVVELDWLSPGAHINAVGSCAPTMRELDGATVAASVLVVDRMESAMNEAGDILLACEEGLIDEQHIAGELGQLLADGSQARQSDHDLTVFKSLGLSIEDVACAHFVYSQLIETGGGLNLHLGGLRHDED